MSLVEEQNLFLQQISKLITEAHDLGLIISAGELYRTAEQQKLHIQAGRSKTMNSQHLKRLAMDLNFFTREPNGKLKLTYDHESIRKLGSYWESLDSANRWGGNWSNFKDTPHFERREGLFNSVPSQQTRGIPITKGMNLLTGSVGYQCDNHRDDVEIVQHLLNLNENLYSLDEPLVCDGIYGTNTRNAIIKFEESKLGESKSDKKITPQDQTLQALCEQLSDQVDVNFLKILYLSANNEAINNFSNEIRECMARYNINTPLQQAHFLAQIGHESGELNFREEIASGRAYEGRRDLGNLEPGDGTRYKGRGLIQLTGRANYNEYSKSNKFEINVLEHPELVATRDNLCVDVAGWFWERRGLNSLAEQDMLEHITRKINGGLNGIRHRRKLLLRAKSLFGI